MSTSGIVSIAREVRRRPTNSWRRHVTASTIEGTYMDPRDKYTRKGVVRKSCIGASPDGRGFYTYVYTGYNNDHP